MMSIAEEYGENSSEVDRYHYLGHQLGEEFHCPGIVDVRATFVR